MRIGITLNEVVRDFKGNFIEVHKEYLESLEKFVETPLDEDLELEFDDQTENSAENLESLEPQLFNGTPVNEIQEMKSVFVQQMDLTDTPIDVTNPDDFVMKPLEVEDDRTLLNLPESDDIEGMSKVCTFIDKADYKEFVYEDFAFQLFGKTNPSYPNAVHDLNVLYQMMVEMGHSVTIVSQERSSSIPATHLFLAQNNFRCNNTKFLYDYSQVWELYDLIITANPYIIKTKPKNKLCFKINSEYNKVEHLTDKLENRANMSFDNLKEIRSFWLEKSKEVAEA
jgi:hypothetical protein